MKKQTLLAISAYALLGSSLAFAGPYLQAELGTGGMDTSKHQLGAKHVDFGSNVVEKDHLRDGMSYRLGVGYLMGQEGAWDYGVEFGYDSYADNEVKFSATGKSAKMTYERSDFDLRAVGVWKATDSIAILGKAGFARAAQKVKVKGLGDVDSHYANYSKDESAFKPELGIGLGYMLSHALCVHVFYNHVMGDKPYRIEKAIDTNKHDRIKDVAPVNNLLFGVDYHF